MMCILFYVFFMLWWGFVVLFFFFFKQKTAYEMRISDWSSDVCSSDLAGAVGADGVRPRARLAAADQGQRKHGREQMMPPHLATACTSSAAGDRKSVV